MNGILITFEGIEGCGKSTQSKMLANYLEGREKACVLSREPGGTFVGERIRDILLNESVGHFTELFLFLADRREHVEKLIRPALKEGKTVILDRYYHSTYAYQIGGRGLDSERVKKLNEVAIDGVKPDLTFFIDIPVEEGFRRKGDAKMRLDRIERENAEFHHRIRDYFLLCLKSEENFIRIDGTQSEENIHREIVEKINNTFDLGI